MEKKPNKKKIYNNHAPILIDSSEHSDSDSNYQPEPSPKKKLNAIQNINDDEMVENCAKAFLKQYQYRKRKEVYETSLEIISGMLDKCKVFSESITEFFKSHKKEFKKGVQRLKNKENNIFMLITHQK
jgi:hypothetical protein